MRPLSIVLLALGCAAAQDSKPFVDPSPHRTQFVTVENEVRLEVLDWGGSGRPLVFLAGYLTAHAYDDIAPKLTGIAHVYGITRRGLGASSKPPGGYTARESAEDVVRVLEALRMEKPVLAGHSFKEHAQNGLAPAPRRPRVPSRLVPRLRGLCAFGGQDLSVIGAAYPDRVGGLVYLDSAEDTSLSPITGARAQPEASKLPEAMRSIPQPDKSSFAAYRKTQREMMGMAFPEAELRQLFAANPDGSVGRYLVSKEVRDAMFAGLQAPEYGRIRVPVLALFALPRPLEDQMKLNQPRDAEQGAAMGLKYGLDLAWRARNEDALKRGVPGARVVEVPGATYIFLSNEAAVAREMRVFLADVVPSAHVPAAR